MLTHKNVIANILQYNSREAAKPDHVPWYVLGVLPQSHAFALIGTCHMSMLLGLGVVILPSFDMLEMLRCIQSYRIEELWLVRFDSDTFPKEKKRVPDKMMILCENKDKNNGKADQLWIMVLA